MATTFVPFDPGVLTEQNLRNIDFVRGKFNEAVQAVGVRDTEIQRITAANGELQKRFAEADRQVAARDEELLGVRKELAVQAGRVQESVFWRFEGAFTG